MRTAEHPRFKRPVKSLRQLAILFSLLLTQTLCALAQSDSVPTDIRQEMSQGIRAYKANKFFEAERSFKIALDRHPDLLEARLYLATSYANQYVPGSETDENLKVGAQAISEFQKVLETDPGNLSAIAGIASLYFQMKRMDNAKEYYKKQIALDPQSPKPYYSIGVIDWSLAYQKRMAERQKLNLWSTPNEPISDRNVRESLRASNASLIDEGMLLLEKAILLRPDFDDAMAYLNSLYRERADIDDAPEQRQSDLKTAGEWVVKAIDLKREKARAQAPQSGVRHE